MMKVNVLKLICSDKIKYFTQFCIYETLHCSDYCINPKMNIEAISDLKIINTKLISTIKGTSIEGQCLTGKKLVVMSVLVAHLIITNEHFENKRYLKKIKLPFSNYIIVPDDTCENQPINLRYLIEDTTVTVISSHEILISACVILQYVDQYIKE